jgi:hypothetical protein
MPISGTDFVRYIAMISFLAEYRRKRDLEPIKPRVIYAASGGCIVAYIAMMSSFTERIEGWTFTSDMFVNRPTPFTPRMLTFSLKGFFYYRTDLTDYIKENFIPCKLQDVEIVTGYYEKIEQVDLRSVIKIVTNYPPSQSVLTPQRPIPNVQIVYPREKPELDLGVESSRSELKSYLDSLMSLFTDALHKTSNVPYMMEPLGKSECIDYGIVAPSPRTITNADVNRSIYFSPIDIDRLDVIDDIDMIFHHYITNDIISIQNQFETSQRFTGWDVEQSFTSAMTLIQKLRLCGKRYCLLIYTTANINIPIHSFDGKMVKDGIRSCKLKLRFLVLHD